MALRATEVFGVLRKKIKSVVSGVKGHRVDQDNTSLIFEFNDGTTETIKFKAPKDGATPDRAEIDGNNHLIFIMSDGRRIDGGELPIGANAVFTKELVASVQIGQVKIGTTYRKDQLLEDAIVDILTEKNPPTITMSYSPAKNIYDVVTETLSTLSISINVVKGTNDVKNIKIYVGNTVIKEYNSGIADGGRFTYVHTFNPPTKDDPINIRATVEDTEGLNNQASGTIRFVGNSYYGYVDAAVGEPGEADIKVLQNKTLKIVKGFTYRGFTFDWGKVVYAYPESFGALTKIMDEKNNVNYTNSFTMRKVTVDNIPYLCYTLNNPTGAVDNELTFS